MLTACLLWRKDPGFWNQVSEETSPHLLFGAQDQWQLLSKISHFVGPQEPFLATVYRFKLAQFGHVTCLTAFSQSFSRAPWRVGDIVVSRENAGWTTSSSGHSCPCQNCSLRPHAENIGRESLLNRPLSLPSWSRNWTELTCIFMHTYSLPFFPLTWPMQVTWWWKPIIYLLFPFDLCVKTPLSSPELTLCAHSCSVSVPPPTRTPVTAVASKRLRSFCQSAGGRLHLNTHTPLTQQSQSELTMLLSRHSLGTYPETSAHATSQGTMGHSHLSSLSHCGLILA